MFFRTSPKLLQILLKKDVAAVIEDFNKDGKADLFIGSGGADFFNEMKPLLDTYYLQKDSVFSKTAIPDYFENASVIKTVDFDRDGDLDVFVGSQAVSNDFGNTPTSFLLKNENGNLSVVTNTALQKAGMITDALWHDFDLDGQEDLVIIGEWMSPKFFKNNEGALKEITPLNSEIKGPMAKHRTL